MKRDLVEDAVRVAGFGAMLNLGGEPFLSAARAALLRPVDLPNWTSARSYDLRSIYPQSLIGHAAGDTSVDMVAVAQDLIASYLHLFSERLQYGRNLPRGAYKRLGRVLDRIEGAFRYVNRDTVALRKCLTSRSADDEERLGSHAGLNLASETARLLLALAERRDDPIATAKRLFENYFALEAGLFTIGESSQRPLRFLIDPIVLDGLISLLEALGAPPRPPVDYYRANDPTTDTILDAFASLRTIPDFPRPIAPVEPEESWAALLESISYVVRQVAHETCGFAVRLQPLPIEVPFALLLRRDVDRALSDQECDAHLLWEKSAGLRSAWYFKHDTFREELAERIGHCGGEIGWHVCHADTGDGGIVNILRNKYGAQGCNHHGGQDSSFWRGQATLKSLARYGLFYAERIGDWTPHPLFDETHDMVLFPTPLKVESRPAWVVNHESLIRRFRGTMVVENHPDYWTNHLKEKIEHWQAEKAFAILPQDHAHTIRCIYNATAHVARDESTTTIGMPLPMSASIELTRADRQKDGRVTHTSGLCEVVDGDPDSSMNWNVVDRYVSLTLPVSKP